MFEIRRIPDQDFSRMVEIVDNAYPAFAKNTPEANERLTERLLKIQHEDSTVNFYGGYKDDKLTSTMRFHDYKMNFSGKQLDVGGIGLVAVDLLHKKEKQAKHLIEFFLEHYQDRDVNILMLYPFRPDFYKKMGFGFGSKMEQYKIKPEAFPNYHNKEHLVYLSSDDKELIDDCYQKYANQTHGMLHKTEFELEALVNRAEHRMIGYKKDGRLEGYVVFTFKRANVDNFISNDIHIKEFVYLNQSSLRELLTFFHSQADQIRRIVLNTQDEFFHYLFTDARNDTGMMIPSVFHETNTAGVGVMYRIINVEKFFRELEQINFGGITCTVKFSISDSFYPQNSGAVTIDFQEGKAKISANDSFDVEIKMDISDFSSMIVGAVPFKKLYELGLLTVSDEDFVNQLQAMFQVIEKPICTTAF